MLFRNTAWQSAPVMASYLFSALIAPLMLSRLGLAAFGVWAVTGALASWASLLDLGISRALARFVALYHAQEDRRGVSECAGLGLIVVTGIAVVGAAGAIFVGAPILADRLGVLDEGEMRIVLLCSLTIFCANAYNAVFNAVPIGLQRSGPPSAASLAGYTTNFVFSVVVLILSTDLVHYALANAAAGVVAFLIHVGMFARVWGSIAIPSWTRAKEVFGFSLKSQVTWVADLVNFYTDTIVIGLAIGPQAAGAYEIASRVVAAVRSVGVLATGAMVPVATDEIVRRGRSIIPEFYARYTPKQLGVAFPVFGVAAVSAPFLLVAWLGEAPPDSIQILLILIAAYFINIVTNVPMVIVTGDGQPGVLARTSAIMATLNIVLTVSLAPLLGLWGVLLGTFLAITIGSSLFLYRYHRMYGLPARALWQAAGGPAALAIGLAVPFGVYYALATPDVEGRLPAAGGLAVTGALYALAYWVGASRLGYLPERLRLRGRSGGSSGTGSPSAGSSPAGTGRT